MEHLTTVESEPERRKKYRSERRPRKRKMISYVWSYFDLLGDNVKCRVCQHEMRAKEDKSTSELIWHLMRTHGVRNRRVVKDFSLLPTKLTQTSNLKLCMRERTFKSFADSGGGLWRCIHCNYAVEDRELLPMFQHLKTSHWKPSKPALHTLIIKTENTIADNGSDQPSTDSEPTENHISEDVTTAFEHATSEDPSKAVEEDESWSFDQLDVDNEAEIPRTSSSVLVGDAAMDGDDVKLCEVKIDLPDGDEVQSFVAGEQNDPGNAAMDGNAVSLDHNYPNDQLQSLTPIVVLKEADWNVQRAVDDQNGALENEANNPQALVGDDRRKFDHWYSRKLGKRPTLTNLRQTKARRSLPAIRMCKSTRNSVEEIKSKELDPQELEIQVPLQQALALSTDDRHDRNGQLVSYEYIRTEKAGKKQNVAVVTLNRPKALNALCKKLIDELNDAVTKFDNDDDIGVIIITGSERAFAAGNDIKEMQHLTYARTIKENVLGSWSGISNASKPIIAAVNGYALGGGCELAMMCDIIYAGEKAWFGQPEIVMGTIPGAGGGQRLTRAVGKSKAMEMMLTGNQISAVEAERSGLISKIFPPENLLSEAIKLGERISTHSKLIVPMAKEAVNSAYETTLQAGLNFEKKLFSETLATADREEGMAAFIAKRPPKFRNE